MIHAQKQNVLALAFAAVLAVGSQAFAAERTSPELTKWRSAVKIILSSGSTATQERARQIISTSGPALPPAERDMARDYLHALFRRGFRADTLAGPYPCLFSPGATERRHNLLNALKDLDWVRLDQSALAALLAEMREQPDTFPTSKLMYPDFVEFTRKVDAGALLDADGHTPLLASVVMARQEAGAFLDALCFGHRVCNQPAVQSRLGTCFAQRFTANSPTEEAATAFKRLENDQNWQSVDAARRGYQRHLADVIFGKEPLDNWPMLESSCSESAALLAKMASCGSGSGVFKDGLDWAERLARALAQEEDKAALELLYHLSGKMPSLTQTFDRLEPLFAGQQRFFIYLHQPVFNGEAVMGRLTGQPAVRQRAIAILQRFLSPDRESQWVEALFPLMVHYYLPMDAQERDAFWTATVTPIYSPYDTEAQNAADAAVPEAPASILAQPLRRRLLDSLRSPIGDFPKAFPDVEHQRQTAIWFREHVDLRTSVALSGGSSPNYRFVDEILLDSVTRRLPESAADPAHAYVCAHDLAEWANWLLGGMLAHPEQLNLEDTGLYGCMSASLERIRTVKERFDLRNRDKMGLGVLFERLHLQLKADVIRFRSSETGTGEAGRERLARTLHLWLVVSALLAEPSEMNAVFSTLRQDLFQLPEKVCLRVLDEGEMVFQTRIFTTLHEDILSCLAATAKALGNRSGATEFRETFLWQYHTDIQLPLVATDRFLARVFEQEGEALASLFLVEPGKRYKLALPAGRRQESLEKFETTLAACGFINGEAPVIELLKAYRRTLALSFWRKPDLFKLNANLNLPVLQELLRSEAPPTLAELGALMEHTDGNWPEPTLLPVVDFFMTSFTKDMHKLCIRTMTYRTAATGAIEPASTDAYDAWQFAQFTECLLRTQEILSFPPTLDEKPLPLRPMAEALFRSACSGLSPELPPVQVTPGDDGRCRERRHIDGSRRVRLVQLLAENRPTGKSAVDLAEFALRLPNSLDNAVSAEPLPAYAQSRSGAALAAMDAVRQGLPQGELTDALIALLRLELSQGDQKPQIPAREFAEEMASRLDDTGYGRVLLELSVQASRMAAPLSPKACQAHGEAPLLTCRACRDALATRLRGRRDELVRLRRFYAANAGINMEQLPKDLHEMIAQMCRAKRKKQNCRAIIQNIGPDAARSAYYLLNQVRRALREVPPDWTAKDMATTIGWDEPMAETLVALQRLGVATYADILPYAGDFNLSDFLGDKDSAGNGDALVAFSLMDGEMKNLLLRTVPLTRKVETETKLLFAPAGTPDTAEMVLVHSMVQPSLVARVWNEGERKMVDGSRLLEFVCSGKAYRESYFDPLLVLDVNSQFRVEPAVLFEEAFRSIDLVVSAADADGMARDSLVYEAWFGDLRASLTAEGLAPSQIFNIDTFARDCIGIPGDRRYDGIEPASIREFAATFQTQVGEWLDRDGPATLSRLLAEADSPRALVAVGNRICLRLGVPLTMADDDGVRLDSAMAASYGKICRKAMLDSTGGRPAFPAEVRRGICRRFAADLETPEELQERRQQFLALFGDVELPRWSPAVDRSEEAELRRLPGFISLCQTARRLPPGTVNSAFPREFGYAFVQLVSEVYWYGAIDGAEGQSRSALPLSHPWRVDERGKAYIDEPLPAAADAEGALHGETIRHNAEWRAACAENVREIPVLYHFFGGAVSAQDASPVNNRKD